MNKLVGLASAAALMLPLAGWAEPKSVTDFDLAPRIAEKVAAYNKANKQVAILCNHQKTVSKAAEAGLEKNKEELELIKQQAGVL